MILLDTCWLIDFIAAKPHCISRIEEWVAARVKLCTAAVCWSEFLTGPVTGPQISAVSALIEHAILAFGEVEAIKAAELFNLTGRRRGSRVDSFVAAVAIVHSAELATTNVVDFAPFRIHGLEIAE